MQVSLRTTSFAAFSLGRKLQKVKFALFPVVALIYSPAAMGLLLLLLFRALPPHAAVQGGLGSATLGSSPSETLERFYSFSSHIFIRYLVFYYKNHYLRMIENAFSFDDDDCVGNELKCPAWLV